MQWAWQVFHHCVHDAFFLLLITTASWHSLLRSSQAARCRLFLGSCCLSLGLFTLFQAILELKQKHKFADKSSDKKYIANLYLTKAHKEKKSIHLKKKNMFQSKHHGKRSIIALSASFLKSKCFL